MGKGNDLGAHEHECPRLKFPVDFLNLVILFGTLAVKGDRSIAIVERLGTRCPVSEILKALGAIGKVGVHLHPQAGKGRNRIVPVRDRHRKCPERKPSLF